MSDVKLWAHSGDSHSQGPRILFGRDPARRRWPSGPAAERARRRRRDRARRRSDVPAQAPEARDEEGERRLDHQELVTRPPGATRHRRARLADLDPEGVWGEVIYPSLGLWNPLIKDPELVRGASRGPERVDRVEIQGVAVDDRLVPTAELPLLTVQHAVDEVYHVGRDRPARVSLPTGLPEGVDDYNRTRGSRCGRPSTRPTWCCRSTSVPTAPTPRRCTAAPVARCSTTSRPPSVASARR